MPNFNGVIEKTKSLFLNKKFLLIIIVVAIFLAVALYVYNTYIAPKINPDFVPNREFGIGDGDPEGAGGSPSKTAEIYLFSVDWCNHSKEARPHWDSVKKSFNNKQIQGSHYFINFIELDGDKDEAQIDSFEAEYLTPNGKKIDGYPSIWLVKDNNVYEFAAKPTKNALTEFITTLV